MDKKEQRAKLKQLQMICHMRADEDLPLVAKELREALEGIEEPKQERGEAGGRDRKERGGRNREG